jgi:ribulose-5-phosphate 4-epimerase/fuculose-1-phosphate aldolase
MGAPHAGEGVVKFAAEHRREPLDARRCGELACALVAWREILAQTGLVGRDAGLYGGAAYGNVSARLGAPSLPRRRRAFLVTGSQTAGRRAVGLGDFCVVDAYDPESNRVASRGPCLPSSESMTHGAVYDLGSHIRFVFHVHSPAIWRRAAALRLAATSAEVAYGTPEMAREVERLWGTSALSESQIFAMGGHQDGIVVFGRTAAEAGEVLLRHLALAYQAHCATTLGVAPR